MASFMNKPHSHDLLPLGLVVADEAFLAVGLNIAGALGMARSAFTPE